ncbi:organic cation transporter protein-like [Aricia agestis]|uniref:organic cation transporter protein-like n=1 Tax=Aricia agestis TaxID=91739 RepID=UPI001C20A578|nr:organic cation transporter protein-like [Aricia agestis]
MEAATEITKGESKSKMERLDLDDVLVNELGQFGRFALRNLILVSIPTIMSGFMSEYIFSAAAIPHRCQIQECGEYNNLHNYEPEWILNAVPATVSGFSSCLRYVSIANVNGTLENCPANIFDRSQTVDCDEFVYARDNSVVYDFNLGCQDWLRALAGTLSSVGTLFVLPIIGIISDKFGRRIALVICIFNVALFGLMRAYSVNYIMYLVTQVLQSALGGGIYSCAYIFAAELVGPKYRVLVSAISSTMFSVGLVVLGIVAWVIQPWRYMIMALFIPCFLVISYYFILSESVRWLLSKQKFDEAKKVLLNVARVNKTHISDKSLEALMNPKPEPVTEHSKSGLIKRVLKSPVLLRRVCTTPIWWITSTLVYYGLSINSTSLSDSMYLNFILTCAIEIPGNFTAVFILDRVGRRQTLSVCFFCTAICNIAFIFIPSDLEALRLIVFLLGKFFISIVMTVLYLFTSELYPTEFRHTLLAFSSMIGRIGSITAPLTPVLADYWTPFPSVLFGVSAVLSGGLVLTQPETLGTKMPDTMAEAEALGKKKVEEM